MYYDRFRMMMVSTVHSVDEINDALIRQRLNELNDSLTDVTITHTIIDDPAVVSPGRRRTLSSAEDEGAITVEVEGGEASDDSSAERRVLSHVTYPHVTVQTVVDGRFPFASQPPPHLAALAQFFNMSIDTTTMGYEECRVDETILCPEGTYHNPNLTLTFHEEECIGCPEGTYCPHGAPFPTPCAPGSFGENPNASKCELCAAGSDQQAAGALSCEHCNPGFFCPSGSTSPSLAQRARLTRWQRDKRQRVRGHAGRALLRSWQRPAVSMSPGLVFEWERTRVRAVPLGQACARPWRAGVRAV